MQKNEKSICLYGREANNTEKNIPQKSLLEMFLENVNKNADSPAIIYDGVNNFSYAQTAMRAAVIAKTLINAGVRHGDRVAVSLPCGKEMICAVLGVLWCGGVYVPLNCSQPSERRTGIYAQADIKYCITESNSSAVQVTDCTNILTDTIPDDNNELPEAYIASPDETAYIIFTSGSTGMPKGVEISHGAAWNTIADIIERFDFTKKDVALGVSALDFDLSVFDIFGMLSVGGAIAVLTDKTRREPFKWIKIINSAKVSVWNSVPALLEMLLVSLKHNEKLESLRIVLISGDCIKPSLYPLLKSHTDDCRFIALGGATEASIWSNFYEVTAISDDWTMIPYGKPLSNQQFRIISDGKDADNNITGELWIGGAGLAKGYVSAPELTEKSFVYENGRRWYKTGDLGYYLPDGNIIFVGRKDNQVKINGFRIELGEIENHLCHLDNVSSSAVFSKGEDSGKTLVSALEVSGISEPSRIPETEPVRVNPEDNESCIVANFMHKVLYKDGKAVFNKADLSEDSAGIVTLWEKFLNGNINPLSVTDNSLANILESKTDLLKNIIAGELSPVALLDDELLAPAKLMITSVINDAVRELAKEIQKQIKNFSGDKFIIYLLFGRHGEIYISLLEELSCLSDKIKFVYFESSTSMLNEANQNYDRFDFEIDYIKTDYNRLPAEFAGIADAVVAVNGLHLFTDISLGLNWIKLLIKPDGYLYATEPEKLTAIGLISAGVIEHGFTAYESGRTNGSMLPPESWIKKFGDINLDVASVRQFRNENLYIFILCNNEKNPFMNDCQLKAYCSEKLVSYMIPEKFCYTVRLPLTENGKVDRKSILEWFDAEKSCTGTAPQSNTEKKIAEIWCELFKTENVFIEDNFFEIGGDSLLATRMLNSLRNCFGISISMREIFDTSSLGEIAEFVDKKIDESDLEEGEL